MKNKQKDNDYNENTVVSDLAVISFLVAILSPFTIFTSLGPIIVLIGPIIAIVLGITSLLKIKTSHGKLKGKGFAIAGILIPFLFFTLIFGILLPALGKIKYIVPRIACENHLSALSKAMMIYINDHDQYPTPDKWCDLLVEDCNVPPNTFRCNHVSEGPCNYALNKYVFELGKSPQGDIVVIFESEPGWNQVGGPELLTTENHEGDGCNVAFSDSSVKFIYTKDLDKLKWKPEEKK